MWGARFALALLPALLLGACASVTSGSEQAIAVDTAAVIGASCELSNDKGGWSIAATPGSATVKRSAAGLTVTCRKPGHEPATQSVSSGTSGMLWGNLVAGGIVGVAVDMGSGAAYAYPEAVTVAMRLPGPTGPESTPAPTAPQPAVAGGPRAGGVTRARTNSAPPQRGDPAVALTCYSEKLELLYRRFDCGARDRPVESAEAAEIGARLAGALPSAPPQADEAAFAIAPAGTRIFTSTGGFYEIAEVNGRVVTTVNARSNLSNRVDLFATQDLATTDTDLRPLHAIWPLRVGKSVTYDSSRGTSSWRHFISVLRKERITVPAGTFDTFVVEHRQRGKDKNFFDGTRTYWYAPTVGYFVKHDFTLSAGKWPEGEQPWEALSIGGPEDRLTGES